MGLGSTYKCGQGDTHELGQYSLLPLLCNPISYSPSSHSVWEDPKHLRGFQDSGVGNDKSCLVWLAWKAAWFGLFGPGMGYLLNRRVSGTIQVTHTQSFPSWECGICLPSCQPGRWSWPIAAGKRYSTCLCRLYMPTLDMWNWCKFFLVIF